ncbi:MAG: dTDP-4-dehydrorhamnose 3,5-epimerase family protein [Nanoarchaeota archaeon]|nr:dTDP-4-dehydrorhamnose 3,5-epimerase family protein [Nanoarchaeota archaeon]
MKVSETNLKGVVLIDLESFEDHRGEYLSIHDVSKYKDFGIDLSFLQDSVIFSKKNVLRGIHGDEKTWKLISCLKGEIYQVVINCDKTSDNFGKWTSFYLSDKKRQQILIPPKHGNAFLILSDDAIYNYKQSTNYEPQHQFSYRWDDPLFSIKWPVTNPILSKRDSETKFISHLK